MFRLSLSHLHKHKFLHNTSISPFLQHHLFSQPAQDPTIQQLQHDFLKSDHHPGYETYYRVGLTDHTTNIKSSYERDVLRWVTSSASFIDLNAVFSTTKPRMSLHIITGLISKATELHASQKTVDIFFHEIFSILENHQVELDVRGLATLIGGIGKCKHSLSSKNNVLIQQYLNQLISEFEATEFDISLQGFSLVNDYKMQPIIHFILQRLSSKISTELNGLKLSGYQIPTVFRVCVKFNYNNQQLVNMLCYQLPFQKSTSWGLSVISQDLITLKQSEKLNVFRWIARNSVEQMEEFTVGCLARTLVAFSQLNSPEICQELFERAAQYVCKSIQSELPDEESGETSRYDKREMSLFDMCSIIQAYSKLYLYDAKLFDLVGDYSVQNIKNLDLVGIGKIVRSFARVNHVDVQFMDAVVDAVHYRRGQILPMTITSLVWSYSILRIFKQSLFTSLSEHILRNEFRYENEDLVTVVWGFAYQDVYSREFWVSLSEQLQNYLPKVEWQEKRLVLVQTDEERSSYTLTACDLSKICWSFANVRHWDAILMTALGYEVASRINEFEPEQIATVLWSFAYLRHKHEKLFHAFQDHFPQKLEMFDVSDLVRVMWSCSVMGRYDGYAEWWDIVVNRINQEEEFSAEALQRLYYAKMICDLRGQQELWWPQIREGIRTASFEEWVKIQQYQTSNEVVTSEVMETLSGLQMSPKRTPRLTADSTPNVDIQFVLNNQNVGIWIPRNEELSRTYARKLLGNSNIWYHYLSKREGLLLIFVDCKLWGRLHTKLQKEQFVLQLLLEKGLMQSSN